MGLISDTYHFIMERKAWWIVPIILILVFVGVIVIFSQSSALSPFIYALF